MGIIIFDNPSGNQWFSNYEFALLLPLGYPAGDSKNKAFMSASSGAALLQLYHSGGNVTAVSGMVSGAFFYMER